jgi:hypothetical protein
MEIVALAARYSLTLTAWRDREAVLRLLVDHRRPRGRDGVMEFGGRMYSLPAKEFGR